MSHPARAGGGKYDNSPNECPRYDIKQSDAEAPVMLEIWEMRSISSLLSLPGPLWLGVVALDSTCMQKKKSPGSFINVIDKMCLQIINLVFI